MMCGKYKNNCRNDKTQNGVKWKDKKKTNNKIK